MNDYIMYAKATCVSAAALFGVLWCVIGFREAAVDALEALASILLVAGVISVSITLGFLFFDWKNRNEDSDTA